MKKAEGILKEKMKRRNCKYIADLATVDITEAMEEYAYQAKPEPIKTKIDWHSIAADFAASDICSGICSGDDVHPDEIIVWFKERIEKELNSSQE